MASKGKQAAEVAEMLPMGLICPSVKKWQRGRPGWRSRPQIRIQSWRHSSKTWLLLLSSFNPEGRHVYKHKLPACHRPNATSESTHEADTRVFPKQQHMLGGARGGGCGRGGCSHYGRRFQIPNLSPRCASTAATSGVHSAPLWADPGSRRNTGQFPRWIWW